MGRRQGGVDKAMSETDTCREIFKPYCTGKLGLDAGFGSSALLKEPGCLTLDSKTPYTVTGSDKQILRGTCEDLSGFCDGSLQYIYSGHLLEDFSFAKLREVIIPEWHRCLEVGGLLLTNCPWQQKYLQVNRDNGTMDTVNLAHCEPTFGLDTWNEFVIQPTGPWEVVFEEPNHGQYSFLQILRKI